MDENPGQRCILEPEMRRLASIVALVLMLTSVAPVLACMTVGTMSREESACCRSMNGECGQMAKMGCCKTVARTDEAPQIGARAVETSTQWVCVSRLAPLAARIQTPATDISMAPIEHSPPGLLAAKISVLRI